MLKIKHILQPYHPTNYDSYRFSMVLSGTKYTDYTRAYIISDDDLESLYHRHTMTFAEEWRFNTRFAALRYLVRRKHALIQEHIERNNLQWLK
jgi:hypothetical protein